MPEDFRNLGSLEQRLGHQRPSPQHWRLIGFYLHHCQRRWGLTKLPR